MFAKKIHSVSKIRKNMKVKIFALESKKMSLKLVNSQNLACDVTIIDDRGYCERKVLIMYILQT